MKNPVSDDEAPKSAVELAMARLKREDTEAGIEARPVSKAQRAALAEIRKVYEARLAEREILHNAALRKAGGDPAALEVLDEQYRRDRDRLLSERETKIEEARLTRIIHEAPRARE